MLRSRLFLGLLTLVVLLWAVGGTGFVIIRDTGKRFEDGLNANYQIIELSYGYRNTTSLVNSTYLANLVIGKPGASPDAATMEKARSEAMQSHGKLKALVSGIEPWETSVRDLGNLLEAYFEAHAVEFSAPDNDSSRPARISRIISTTQKITETAAHLAKISEERMMKDTERLVAESRRNLLLITSLVVLGTCMAGLIYFQLLRDLVQPVVGLQNSINEVKRGNYESRLPSLLRANEFSKLVSSFNEMSSELRMRRNETDLRLLRKNLLNRALLSAIPSPVYVVADDFPSPVLNPAAEELNKQLGEGPVLPPKVRLLYTQCIGSGENLRPEDPREAVLFRLGSEEKYYLPRIFQFSSEDGSHTGWAILLHDVTRIRWLDDMKSNMLATVSHEIKTPLTGIRMVLLLLLEEQIGPLTEPQKTMLTSASGDCERLLATLNTLLDLSRAESGNTRLNCGPFDLAKAAAESVNLFNPNATAKNICLTLDAQPGLPTVNADGLRLREVVNNLVSNAIKHCPEGGNVRLKISRLDEDFLRLSVFDDGPGVPTEAQDRIFERFYRADNNQLDGVGLGLFICREIMRAHEGRISVREKEAGQPTEFQIDVRIT